MLASFSELKFFQSFRIPVESADNVRCMVEYKDHVGKFHYIDDAKLLDVSVTGIGFSTTQRISVGDELRISIQFKRLRLDMSAEVVRSFGNGLDDCLMYGAELDEDDTESMRRFIQQYIFSFSQDRAKESLASLALAERYKNAQEGFEIFSLMLSLFNDITRFGGKEGYAETMLQEVTRILNAQRASIFLINPETNELEALCALGVDKKMLKFDYRKGIAGSVFTTSVPLNIDATTDKVRFSQYIDDKTGYTTKSIICNPITNREDKVIGVLEVLNKRNEDRFTADDEKTMKVLSLIFSSVFHDYNPISEKSLIRRFSTPFDREFALVGRSDVTHQMRKTIIKLKDLETPVLVKGEGGSGKKLYARILHNEGKRGLNQYFEVDCRGKDEQSLEEEIFGSETTAGVLEKCIGGSIVFHEISFLPLNLQNKLLRVLKSGQLVPREMAIDVRSFFTSSFDLRRKSEVEGTFNSELYKVITGAVVKIEPLRNRKEDLNDLLNYFMRKECGRQGFLLKEFSAEALEQLREYTWPGNISELQSVVSKVVLYNPKTHVINTIHSKVTPIIDVSQTTVSGFEDIPHVQDFSINLKDRVLLVEREMILAEIKRSGGNKSRAAKEMGISREALRKKLLQSDEVINRLSDKGDEKVAA